MWTSPTFPADFTAFAAEGPLNTYTPKNPLKSGLLRRAVSAGHP
jgi:hypothetical protein